MTCVLPVVRVQQQGNYWCWAACGEMLGHYFGKDYRQCDAINKCFNGTTACEDPASIDVPLSPEKIGPQLASWGLHNSYYNQGLPRQYISEEIEAKRPVMAMVALGLSDATNSGVYHAVIIAGYSDNGMVYKVDPWFGAGSGWVLCSDMDWEGSWAQFHL